MTAQRWEQVKGMDELPMDVFFEYYQEKGGFLRDFNTFRRFFEKIIYDRLTTRTPKGVRMVTHHSALQSVYTYYNKKFDAVTN